MKLTKKRILILAGILAVLVFAFWYGGDSVNSRGWSVQQEQTVSEESQTPAPETPERVEDAVPESMPIDSETTPAPEQEPRPAEQKKTPAEPKKAAPAEAPTPAQEPQQEPAKDELFTCTLSISCATILNNMEHCDPEKAGLVPADGVILAAVTIPFEEGESVFNVLQRTCKQHGIHMEFVNTPAYQSAYIEGIANLYEFDVGQLSGWMYRVNGKFPNYGCSRYQLHDGDVIEWVYTCDLGYDVGGGYVVNGDE